MDKFANKRELQLTPEASPAASSRDDPEATWKLVW